MRIGIFSKKLAIIAILSVVFSLTLFMPAFAADALYRFMHNDHDALIIGEVTKVSDNEITVSVIKNIISANDLNVNAPKKQLDIKEAVITGVTGYALNYKDDGVPLNYPKVGDKVLASLVKKNNVFRIAWGLYKVDNTDYKTLSLVYPDNAPEYIKMDAAAIEAFINSNGKLTDFSFNGDTKTVSSRDGKTIYDGSKPDKPENVVSPEPTENTTSENSLILSTNFLKSIAIGSSIIVIAIIIMVAILKKKH